LYSKIYLFLEEQLQEEGEWVQVTKKNKSGNVVDQTKEKRSSKAKIDDDYLDQF